MLGKLGFYFRHSLNDLRVNGRRTLFALLCVAAGVAAIVSLQTVGVMIGDTLTGNLQETNRGDIQVLPPLNFGFVNEPIPEYEAAVESGFLEKDTFSGGFGMVGEAITYEIGPGGIEQMQAWLDENYPGEAEMTYRLMVADMGSIFTSSGPGTVVENPETGAAATQITPVMIEPDKYPFYDTVDSLDGTPLAELIQSATDIVVDKRVADTLEVSVGDTVRLNGAEASFTVRGIVPTEAEVTDFSSGFFAALFGFYYLSPDAAPLFDDLEPAVEKMYLRLDDSARTAEVHAALMRQFPFVDTTTIDDLREQNQEISEQVNQLVSVMGLVSMLLGSIGIINTMQVIVRRRTVEVAVLKTIGLQAGQVTILFLVEAFIMGVVGSLLGVLLGWATVFVIKGVAESLVAQPLAFRPVLMPVVNGVVVGTLVTTVFGFLPTLAAGQVRPGVVLRPNDNIVPRAGCLQTLLALVVIVLVLSAVANTILNSFGTALAVTIGAFIAAGFLIGLLWAMIWLVGKLFPSLGVVDLKLSLRQMLVTRTRGAITLLALVVGVFSLSLITLMADSINNLLSYSLGTGLGGNVIVTVAGEQMIPRIEDLLNSAEGVNKYRTDYAFVGEVIGLEEADGTVLDADGLRERISTNNEAAFFMAMAGEEAEEVDFGDVFLRSLGSVSGNPVEQVPDVNFIAGRQLTAEDAGQPVIVIPDNDVVRYADLDVGDRLVYRFGEGADATTITFEIVGITQQSLVGGLGSSGIYAPRDAFPASIPASSVSVLVDVDEEQVNALRRELARIPGAFMLETAVITRLLEGLLATFIAFPTMVALLGIVVGGVVIANSVALSTMERRREIAVMKAVGLQRERVMGMILLENAIMGLIGGLIGVGIGLLALVLMLSISQGPGNIIPIGTALLLMGMCIAVALIAAATTAWGASGEKPLNVLRYE